MITMAFFGIDGPFYRFICRFIDLVKLNFMWLLFSLPIVTIGASTTAAYSIALKMVDDEEGYMVKSFVKEFKRNFKQGTVMGLIGLVASYAIYLDYEINRVSEEGSVVLLVIGLVSAFFVIMALLYAFPLLARYENTIVGTIQNSLDISRKYFGRTLIIITVLQIFGLIFGPAFMMFTIAAFAKRIFQEIEKEPGAVRKSSSGQEE